MRALLAVAGLATALLAASPAIATAQGRLVTNPNELRDIAKQRVKSPQGAVDPVRFRLDLPLADDTKADIEDLQNSAGWRVVGPNFVINFDMGVITPQNFNTFEKDDLYNAPPLRVLYFWTRRSRQEASRLVPGEREDNFSSSKGWLEQTESYGLAVATSAEAKGVSGGDLPDDFTLPFALQFPKPPGQASFLASGLRVRVEGELRTLRGRSVFCGDQRNGAGYAKDEFTQKTPFTPIVHQCFLPAVITRISLVTVRAGPPLKVWTRADREPTPENDQTKVMLQRDPRLVNAPTTTIPSEDTPNSTAPLPKRTADGEIASPTGAASRPGAVTPSSTAAPGPSPR